MYFRAFKRGFIHVIKVNGPLWEAAPTQEIDDPFRTGVCYIFRIPFTEIGLGFGRWTGCMDEWDALSFAINMRALEEVDTEEVRTW